MKKGKNPDPNVIHPIAGYDKAMDDAAGIEQG